jgi:hypothetical protein
MVFGCPGPGRAAGSAVARMTDPLASPAASGRFDKRETVEVIAIEATVARQQPIGVVGGVRAD